MLNSMRFFSLICHLLITNISYGHFATIVVIMLYFFYDLRYTSNVYIAFAQNKQDNLV